MPKQTAEHLDATVYLPNSQHYNFSYPVTTADNEYMSIAIEEAEIAFELGNYPVGAVLANSKGDVWRDHALEHSSGRLRHHAEGGVIDKYNDDTGTRLLKELSMYVSYVPCVGCSYFIDQGELGLLYVAADRDDVIAKTTDNAGRALVRKKGLNMPDILHESPRTMMVVSGLMKAASVEIFVRKHEEEQEAKRLLSQQRRKDD